MDSEEAIKKMQITKKGKWQTLIIVFKNGETATIRLPSIRSVQHFCQGAEVEPTHIVLV